MGPDRRRPAVTRDEAAWASGEGAAGAGAGEAGARGRPPAQRCGFCSAISASISQILQISEARRRGCATVSGGEMGEIETFPRPQHRAPRRTAGTPAPPPAISPHLPATSPHLPATSPHLPAGRAPRCPRQVGGRRTQGSGRPAPRSARSARVRVGDLRSGPVAVGGGSGCMHWPRSGSRPGQGQSRGQGQGQGQQLACGTSEIAAPCSAASTSCALNPRASHTPGARWGTTLPSRPATVDSRWRSK